MSFNESATDRNTSGFSLYGRLLLGFQARKQLIWLGCSSSVTLVTALVKFKAKATLLGFSFSFFFVGRGYLIERNITCGGRKQNLPDPRHTRSLSLPVSVMKCLEIHPRPNPLRHHRRPLGLIKKQMSNFSCKEIVLLAPLELILGTAPLRDDWQFHNGKFCHSDRKKWHPGVCREERWTQVSRLIIIWAIMHERKQGSL